MFDVDSFIAECVAAVAEPEPLLAVRDVLERAVARRDAISDALPATRGELRPLHVADDLTVLQVVWAPGMTMPPHDHRMWAALGIYAGREDNEFFRPDGARVRPAGARTVEEGATLVLGDDAIHAVTNPLGRCTAAIHVYGGNFFTRSRSQWDAATLERLEDPPPPEQFFADANRRLGL